MSPAAHEAYFTYWTRVAVVFAVGGMAWTALLAYYVKRK